MKGLTRLIYHLGEFLNFNRGGIGFISRRKYYHLRSKYDFCIQ